VAFGHWVRSGPKLSTAYGKDGRYGGYYTQADIRELVAYAQRLHITIVPEIEMPGHSFAVLAAYPELGCTGGPYAVQTKGVRLGNYCPGKEESFEFVKNCWPRWGSYSRQIHPYRRR